MIWTYLHIRVAGGYALACTVPVKEIAAGVEVALTQEANP
jgi:hypothetical protein